MKHFLHNLVPVLTGLLLCGCANTIRYDKDLKTLVERRPQATIYSISYRFAANERAVINLQVKQEQKTKVERSEDEIRSKLETPYQGWREFYEVPMGIGLFPAALVVNLLDFASLGFIPNWMTDDLLDYSFAGMNPFLNIENEERRIKYPVKHHKKLIDQYIEVQHQAAAATKIEVFANGKKLKNLVTDIRGEASINLFDNCYIKQIEQLAELQVRVPGGSQQRGAAVNIILPRRLRYHLSEAQQAIDRYHQNPTPERLAATVVLLENWHFMRQSLLLENSELQQAAGKTAFIRRFQKEIKKLIAGQDKP